MPGRTMAAKTPRFAVICEAQPEGGWTARVPAVPGCITEGESLPETLKNVREALSVCDDVPGAAAHAYDARLDVEFRFPGAFRRKMAAVERAGKVLSLTIERARKSGLPESDIAWFLKRGPLENVGTLVIEEKARRSAPRASPRKRAR